MIQVTRGLISVSHKEGIGQFARRLSRIGVEILSTGGTAEILRKEGVSVRDVKEITGFPELFGGRVKTLHPRIHGGILAKRGDPIHRDEMLRHGILPIDLVVVNLYPFEETIRRTDASFEEILENIDIGGPAMIRSAAKNFQDVAVVVDPGDYEKVAEELERSGGVLGDETLSALARKAFCHTARYDALIAHYLESRGEMFPPLLHVVCEKIGDLRYGENPHQRAALYGDLTSVGPCIVRANKLQGKELSFNNILDADAALELVKEFSHTAVAIIKHVTPCGVALGENVREAYIRARETDPVSAFGGVVAVNRPLDGEAAREMAPVFLEVVVAPTFTPEAREELKRKKDLRLLEVGPLGEEAGPGMDLKKVTGGLLYQEKDRGRIDDVRTCEVVTRRKPTDEEYQALSFLWKVCKYVRSNAIVFGRRDRTIAIGAGQMSRVDSVKLGVMKAILPLAGSVMASDAFFPFRDGVDEAARAGVTAIVQPGGSLRDPEVIRAADEHGMAMVFTRMRHFRH